MTNESPAPGIASASVPVTTLECKARHKNANYAIGLVTLLLASIVAIPLWSVAVSRAAADKADAVNTSQVAHEKAQKVHEEHLHETLREIKTDIKEMQVAVLDKLREVAKAVNGK